MPERAATGAIRGDAEASTPGRSPPSIERHTERGDGQARPALLAFLAVVAAGLIAYVVLGGQRWFFLDEWDLLASRDGGDLRDLLEPHNEHWSSLPILVYRAYFRLFGLRTYLPYQLTAIVLHLIAAGLLRTVMRRAGVSPWFATAASSLFVLFGSGNEDITWAFQIGFTGALVFGLTHLLLADHDGRIDWRDWLGLGAGLAALMCSGVGVTMVVVVGLAVLLRRGWRMALFHAMPLGVLFGAWWFAYGRGNYDLADPTPARIGEFITTGVGAAFDAMGQLPGAGVALGALLVVGLVVAWRHIDRSEVRRGAAAPAALLAGSVVLLMISGLGRAGAFGPDFARQSRYLHLVAAFCLPALAVAANAVAVRWPPLALVGFVLLLVGIPGNIASIDDHARARGDRDLILTLAHLPAATRAPRALQPARDLAIHGSMGWFLEGAESGRIPRADDPSARTVRNATVRLSLFQDGDELASTSRCDLISRPVLRRFEVGQVFTFRRGWVEASAPDGFKPVPFRAENGRAVRIVNGPLDVRLAPVFGHVLLCAG